MVSMTADPADGDGHSRWARRGAATVGLVVAVSALSSLPANAGAAGLLGYATGAGFASWLCWRATLWAVARLR